MYKVAAFYYFTTIDNVEEMQQKIYEHARILHIKGIILLAHEGINATISGNATYIDSFLHYLQEYCGFSGLRAKYSYANDDPFLRLKVRIKKEIVKLDIPHINVAEKVGTYVAPKEWNGFIANDDVVLIDTRNDYEVDIGQFTGAVNPNTANFSDFPAWVEQNRDTLKDKKIAMYCTGGIRCEKATSYMLEQGYEQVYHLQGGILQYLEDIDEKESTWQGDCFVFDRRVAVKHGLDLSDYTMCGACRRPLSAKDRAHSLYEEGVSCHHCLNEYSEAQRAQFKERQKQITLAQKRGIRHLGGQKTPKKQANQNYPMLYSFRRCPYAMRARIALFASHMPFILREIALKDKPADMVIKSPKATVPVFVLQDGRVLDESLDIMLYALQYWQEQYQKPHPWLCPTKGTLNDMITFLNTQIDVTFKQSLDRYKYPSRYQASPYKEGDDAALTCFADEHFNVIINFLQPYNDLLQKQAFLFGQAIALADVGFFPFLRQFIQVDIDKFKACKLHNIYKYYTYFIEHDIFNCVMEKYPLWKIPQKKHAPLLQETPPSYRDDVIINKPSI